MLMPCQVSSIVFIAKGGASFVPITNSLCNGRSTVTSAFASHVPAKIDTALANAAITRRFTDTTASIQQTPPASNYL
jgi:hypothetical protein